MAINSLSAASKGFSGLVSGMNTQEMVEKLLTGTQTKIDKAVSKKATLQNKQTMYREVATKLKTLQSSFLSFTSKTNLLSNAFYNNMTATINAASGTSAGFSVSASSNAKAGNTTVNSITQLATAYTEQSTFKASSAVQGALDQAVAKQLLSDYRGESTQGRDATLTIKVGNKSVTFENAPETFGGQPSTEIVNLLNAKFSGPNGVDATASYVNNKLVITANNPDDYIVVQGNQDSDSKNKSLAMKMFGEVSSLSGKGTFSSAIDSDNYHPSFTLNLDGREQTIHIDLKLLSNYAAATTTTDKEAAADLLVKDINASLNKTFGSGVVAKMNTEKTNIIFEAGENSQRFTIKGNSRVLGLMSLKTGISNKLSTTMALRDLNFTNPLQGNSFAFNINGVDFHYTGDVTLGTVINDINNSKAGVKIAYSDTKDHFTIQFAETGARVSERISMSQTEGNFLSALFGEKAAGSVTGFGVGKEMVGAPITAGVINSFRQGGVFTFNINGKDQKFTIPQKGDKSDYTPEQFTEKLNAAFANSFGFLPDGTQALEFKFTGSGSNGNFSIVSNSKDLVLKTVEENANTNKSLLGFSLGDATLVQNDDARISDAGISFGTDATITIKMGSTDVTINASSASFDADTTFKDVADALQEALQTDMGIGTTKVVFDEKTGAFKVSGVDTSEEVVISFDNGTNGENLDKIFGSKEIRLSTPEMASGRVKTEDGKNAILEINGVQIERASNTFEYDGLSYTLHTVTNTATNVSVARDTDAIVEGIKEFLKLYNETINYVNELYKADATYKDYPPLSDAQKSEMSDREIELWEEKSKEGLLRNDPSLQKILDSMRKAMYTKPEGSSIAIYDLGIATSYYTSDGNFQEISDGDLRAAIEKDPEAVRRLFAGDGGIMNLVNDAINAAVSSSYATPGYLTAVAGSSGLDTTSSIYKQIKEIDNQLVTLENRYWKEYDRYWKQFNQMEQLIQQMNSQSSWLSQMSAG